MESAGRMRSVDMFLNFQVMDINRNALWRRPDLVTAAAIERMNRFWGDESWRTISYRRTRGLFEEIEEKESNKVIAEAFRQRLREVAGFDRVLEPVPMCNSRGAVVYYLFFASQKLVAEKIVRHIFRKYRERAQ